MHLITSINIFNVLFKSDEGYPLAHHLVHCTCTAPRWVSRSLRPARGASWSWRKRGDNGTEGRNLSRNLEPDRADIEGTSPGDWWGKKKLYAILREKNNDQIKRKTMMLGLLAFLIKKFTSVSVGHRETVAELASQLGLVDLNFIPERQFGRDSINVATLIHVYNCQIIYS